MNHPIWANASTLSQRSITVSLNGSFSGTDSTSRKEVEGEHLWTPPTTRHDKPLEVEFRCACFKLSNISTVDFTAHVKFVVVFEWNDERLRGTSLTTNDLPGDLWGPDILLENAQNECAVVYDSFALLDAETGRLKRTVTFHGPVFNPMSLTDFPFDSDELELKFVSICNWRTLDGSRFGNDPVTRVYTLHPMINRKGVDFFFFGWGGKLNEFKILGWSQNVQTPPESEKPISFKLDIHLTRKMQYYYLKIMLPLWLLVITSVAAYGLETDDLGSRFEFLVTLLLSTIAFLYIVQESLPKMGHLTVIDKVVICSLLSLALSILFSFIISVSESPEKINIALAAANQGVYALINLALVAPPHVRYRRHVAKMLLQQEQQHMGKSSRRRLTMSRMDSQVAKSWSLTETTQLRGDHSISKWSFRHTLSKSLSGSLKRTPSESKTSPTFEDSSSSSVCQQSSETQTCQPPLEQASNSLCSEPSTSQLPQSQSETTQTPIRQKMSKQVSFRDHC